VIRVAELTIATGILQVFVNPHRLLGDLGTRWSIAILLGALMAIVAYGLLRGPLRSAIERLLARAAVAAAGDEAAGKQVVVLRERIQRIGYAQLTLGTLILGAMVTARFS
jgi:hypothetical protein